MTEIERNQIKDALFKCAEENEVYEGSIITWCEIPIFTDKE